jgi:hypothetical protein
MDALPPLIILGLLLALDLMALRFGADSRHDAPGRSGWGS